MPLYHSLDMSYWLVNFHCLIKLTYFIICMLKHYTCSSYLAASIDWHHLHRLYISHCLVWFFFLKGSASCHWNCTEEVITVWKERKLWHEVSYCHTSWINSLFLKSLKRQWRNKPDKLTPLTSYLLTPQTFYLY